MKSARLKVAEVGNTALETWLPSSAGANSSVTLKSVGNLGEARVGGRVRTGKRGKNVLRGRRDRPSSKGRESRHVGFLIIC